jgi:hypothetical protein
MTDWKKALQQELQLAANARARQNEGQARVCARRAAGIVIREYYSRQGITSHSSSALDLLTSLSDLADLPAAARQAAEDLTLRVNTDFQLPVAVDLIQAAKTLAESLLPGEIESQSG